MKPRSSKNSKPQLLGNGNHDHTAEGFSILAKIIAQFHANKWGQSMVNKKPLSDTAGVKNGEKT